MRHLAEQFNEQRDERTFVISDRDRSNDRVLHIFQYKLRKHKSSIFDSFITVNSKINFFIM